MTKAEVVLWVYLRSLREIGYNFRRQHPIGPYIADFAILSGKLVVEVDGAVHGSDEEVEHDRRRDAYLRANGWRILRVPNMDVYNDANWVVELILSQAPFRFVLPCGRPNHVPRQRGRISSCPRVVPTIIPIRRRYESWPA